MDNKEYLKNIVNWLNKNYNQNSKNYSIFTGAKPEVIRYDEHIAISLWACGAIVCIKSIMYFIEEDDGNWFLSEAKTSDKYEDYGYQTHFSIGWAKNFHDAMKRLEDYTKENGKPVYFSGTNVICCYEL
jgi:hypothetical protein